MLSNSAYKNEFTGGKFVCLSLSCNDYQYYISPINGVVLETCKIPGIVSLGTKKTSDGEVEFCKGRQFQFIQDRGVIVLNNDIIGLVAIIPLGLLQISYVDIKVAVGDSILKGDVLGDFRYGGSDLIVLFSNSKLDLLGKCGSHYTQRDIMAVL